MGLVDVAEQCLRRAVQADRLQHSGDIVFMMIDRMTAVVNTPSGLGSQSGSHTRKPAWQALLCFIESWLIARDCF